MSVQARVRPDGLKESPWTDYGRGVTHAKAAELHSERYPFRRIVIETRWSDRDVIFTHHVTRETRVIVNSLRGD